MPLQITIMVMQIKNPLDNIITETFQIVTETWDGYLIDTLEEGLNVNFFCVFPCKQCDEENDPSYCLSCYW